MKCIRCHKPILDDGKPVKIPWFIRIGMVLGYIPTEFYCMECHMLRRER